MKITINCPNELVDAAVGSLVPLVVLQEAVCLQCIDTVSLVTGWAILSRVNYENIH